MLPILNLANLYSEDKIANKYACFTAGDTLLENLFYEFLDSVRFIDDYYDLLAGHYYEANDIINRWQNDTEITTTSNPFSDFFDEQVSLEENIYWKSECSQKETKEILHDLIPLWSSLLALKIANEDMNREAFDTFLDDMYSYMQSKEGEILRYPYKVRFHSDKNMAPPEGTHQCEDPTESVTVEKVNTKRKSSLAPLLVIGLLLAAGIWFFGSGTYEKMSQKSDDAKKDTFYNLVIDSTRSDSLMLSSTMSDTELYISPQALPFLDKLYLQDSFRLSTADSIDDIESILSLSALDSNLHYDISMSKKNQEIFNKKYPNLEYKSVPLDKDSTYITITLKHK